MFSGINPEGRNSSKVLRPPGGGSSLGPFSADCEEITTTKAPPAKTEVPPPAEEKITKDEVTITEKSLCGLLDERSWKSCQAQPYNRPPRIDLKI